jgi:hypothetical protein
MASLFRKYVVRLPRLAVFMTMLAACLAWPAPGVLAEEVRIPITLDYALIRAIFIRNAFTAPGQRAVVVDKDQGCTRVELWDLSVAPDGQMIKLRARIKVKAGLTVLGKCLGPVDWEGWLEAWQNAELDPQAMFFRVRTQKTRLLKENGAPATVGNMVLSLVETYVKDYLDQLSVNLTPPVRDLEIQLPLFIREDQRPMVAAWLASLKPVEARVGKDAVKVIMTMQVDLPPQPPQPPQPEELPELTQKELAAFAKYWEAWDAYLVNQIKSLAGKHITPEERDDLLSAMLDARMGFVSALARPNEELGQGRDLVREQFVQTWKRLSPILRKYLLPRPDQSLFNYLAFLTAQDAIETLDKLGPKLGLDLSREGLMRLARLVDQAGYYPELDYNYDVDAQLRELLGFGPPLEIRGKRYDPRDFEPKEKSGWLDWLAKPAWAAGTIAEGEAAGHLAIAMEWAPPPPGQAKALKEYTAKVRAMLDESAAKAMDEKEHSQERRRFFRLLILATAWQESCWRQFKRENGGLVYLRSYNNTSVGILQINERVWRGLYDLESLRWDAVYNARAGCQIMENYLRRYALRQLKPSQIKDADLLARVLYAMYNGGPGQLRAFLKRKARGRLWRSDKLFFKKYEATKAGGLDQVEACLGGG